MKFRQVLKRRGLSRVAAMGLSGQRLSSLLFAVLALCLLLFSVIRPTGLESVRTGVTDVMAPVIAVVNAPARVAADYVRAVTGLATLQEDNARLRQENARLREWYQTAQILKAENDSLQKLLNIELPPAHHFVTAQVIADTGGTYARTALVQAGQAHGVAKGHAVLADEGIIGRVIETGRTSARVLLATDVNARVPVTVKTAGGADIVAVMAGTNDNTPVLVHLPPADIPGEGARVTTSGHGGYFPYGLPVGETVKMSDGRWGVRLYADPGALDFVRIVSGSPSLVQPPTVTTSELP